MYLCPYARIIYGEVVCQPKRDYEDYIVEQALTGRPIYLISGPFCPSDVKKDADGRKICWRLP